MESIRDVKPTLPAAPYLGGKRNLAKRLIARIDVIDHVTYAEPFIGMGGVFFRRSHAPKAEVINDLNQDIATFFRILQRHYVQFMEVLRFTITTRTEFERLVNTDPDTLTDLERAARFLYLQRTTFGGRPRNHSFGVSPDRPARFDVTRVGPMLEDLHARLAGVVIECLAYDAFITRYDRKATLFYIDPPYHGSETDYGRGLFSRDDFERLATLLRGIKGRFILSLNDTPEIRETFAAFDIEAVETSYSVGVKTGAGKKAAELIISN